MKQHKGMRSLDVAVLLKIIALGDGWLNKDLAVGLSISPSEISESLNRSRIARLLDLYDILIQYIQPGKPWPNDFRSIHQVRKTGKHGEEVLANYQRYNFVAGKRLIRDDTLELVLQDTVLSPEGVPDTMYLPLDN